ncbi:hypothetical protein NPIL_6401 [Nephila pilipes]|uniref:Uncharacterized protein n=1 Tax=Nephila pilipes TaxID=299642 RepID=A0A8X6UE65_NEPPI|nr:hypothetical protein NPIL_6401 [Nephila pilipes]
MEKEVEKKGDKDCHDTEEMEEEVEKESENDSTETEEMEKEVEKKNELLEEGSDDNLPPSSEDFETKTDVEKKLKEKEPEYNGNSECKAQERDSSPSKSKDGNNKADKENIIASDAEISNGNRLPENEASTASKEAASEEDALLAIAEPNSSTDIRSTSEDSTEDDISIIFENGINADPVESSSVVEAKPKDDSRTIPETKPNTDAIDLGAYIGNKDCASEKEEYYEDYYYDFECLSDNVDEESGNEENSTDEACPTSSTNEKKRKRETSSDEDEDAQASAKKVLISSATKLTE